MAKGRILSRRVSHSIKVNNLSLKAQIVWVWTIPYLDDYGTYIADPEDIKSQVFPRNRKITVKKIIEALEEERMVGLISLFKTNGKTYQSYTNFEDFQKFRSDRPRIAEYPCIDSKTQIVGDGLPTTTNDTFKLSKVKLSKVKLSKEKDKDKYGEFVFLTKDEHQKLVKKFGVKGTEQRIEDLNLGIGSKGYKYKSHYHTILSWQRKNEKQSANKISRRIAESSTVGETIEA